LRNALYKKVKLWQLVLLLEAKIREGDLCLSDCSVGAVCRESVMYGSVRSFLALTVRTLMWQDDD